MAGQPSEIRQYSIMSPFEYILKVVVEQSNSFAIQCDTNKPLYLTTKEIDSFIALYHNKIWSRKWYHQLMSHFITVTAWLLYKRDCSSTYEALYFQVEYRRKPV